MIAEFTQFFRPNGRQEIVTTEIDDSLKEKYDSIKASGARLTCEVLTTGHVSFCIEEPTYGDFETELADNGPGVKDAIAKLISSFNVDNYISWREAMKQNEE